MATLGKTSDGAGSSASSADKVAVSKFTAGAGGTVTAGHARAWLSGSGSTNTKVVIYADSAGAPGSLLAQSDVVSLTITSEAQTDYVFSGANQITIVNGTDYWVGLTWQDPGTPSVNLSRDSTASQRQEANTYTPNPFGSPTAQSGPVDVYVDFTTSSTVSATMAAPLGSLGGSMTVVVSHLDPVLAAPLGSLTASATVVVSHLDPVLAAPLGALTGSMTASIPGSVSAVLAAPLGSLTGAMAATVKHIPVLAAPLGSLTAAMTASVTQLPGVAYLQDDLGDAARLTVEAAFGADLTDLDGSGWTWTDITRDVRVNPGLAWRLGRGDESGKTNPAELTLTLTNDDGDYSLGGRSANYPYIRRNTPVHVLIDPDDGDGERVAFLGFATGWRPSWETTRTGRIPVVTLTASGTLRRLGQGAEAVISPVKRYLLNADNVQAYWSCEVGEHATLMPAEFGGQSITWAGNADLASSTDFTASRPLPKTNASGLFRAKVNPYTVAANNTQSVRMMFKIPSSPPADGARLVSIIPTGGNVSRMDLVYGTGEVLRFKAFDDTGAEIISDDVTMGIDGDAGMLSLEFAQSGSTGYLAQKFLGQGSTTYGSSAGDSATCTIGTVSEIWIDAYQTVTGLAFGHIAVMTAGSATDPLTDGYLQIGAYDGELITSTGRLQRVCDENMIDLTFYSGTASTSTYNDFAGPQAIATVLDIIHACEDVERGVLWDGLTPGLAYTTRRRRENADVALTIDAGQLELAAPFEPDDDDQRTRNRWTVNRQDGAEYTVSDTDGPQGTETVGIYADSATINSYYDLAARSLADWLVHSGTVEGYRYPTLTIDLRAVPELAGAVLDLYIGARVDVANLDDALTGGATETVSLVVEQIAHQLTAKTWKVTLTCSPFDVWRVGVFASDTGDTGEFVERLDTDGSTVSTTKAAGQTTLPVATPSGPLWTTDSDDYPMYLDVGGVRVRATACSGASSPQTFTVDALPVARASGLAVSAWNPPVLGL